MRKHQSAEESELVAPIIPLASYPPAKMPSKWFKGMESPRKIAHQIVFQDPGSRAKILLEKFGVDQIIKFSKNIKKAPVSSFDGMLIIQMGNILVLRDGLERERLWDRMFGKVPDKNININLNLDAPSDQLRNRALDLLEKLS